MESPVSCGVGLVLQFAFPVPGVARHQHETTPKRFKGHKDFGPRDSGGTRASDTLDPTSPAECPVNSTGRPCRRAAQMARTVSGNRSSSTPGGSDRLHPRGEAQGWGRGPRGSGTDAVATFSFPADGQASAAPSWSAVHFPRGVHIPPLSCCCFFGPGMPTTGFSPRGVWAGHREAALVTRLPNASCSAASSLVGRATGHRWPHSCASRTGRGGSCEPVPPGRRTSHASGTQKTTSAAWPSLFSKSSSSEEHLKFELTLKEYAEDTFIINQHHKQDRWEGTENVQQDRGN